MLKREPRDKKYFYLVLLFANCFKCYKNDSIFRQLLCSINSHWVFLHQIHILGVYVLWSTLKQCVAQQHQTISSLQYSDNKVFLWRFEFWTGSFDASINILSAKLPYFLYYWVSWNELQQKTHRNFTPLIMWQKDFAANCQASWCPPPSCSGSKPWPEILAFTSWGHSKIY